MRQINAKRNMDELFLRNPLLQKGVFNKLRRYGNKIRFPVFRQFPLHDLGMHHLFSQAEPAIFLFQDLSLVKHVARTALQDRFCPQPAGPPQRIEGATAQPRKDIAIGSLYVLKHDGQIIRRSYIAD